MDDQDDRETTSSSNHFKISGSGFTASMYILQIRPWETSSHSPHPNASQIYCFSKENTGMLLMTFKCQSFHESRYRVFPLSMALEWG